MKNKKTSRRFKKLSARLQNLRKEYLWVIIALLAVGHLLWIIWLLITEIYLIPKAIITEDQASIYQAEVVNKDKFASSYSFYDNWGDLNGTFVVSEYEVNLSAEYVGLEDLPSTVDVGSLMISFEKDGESHLLKTLNMSPKEYKEMSWQDILFVYKDEKIGFIDEVDQSVELCSVEVIDCETFDINFTSGKFGEVETLAYDPSSNSIYVLRVNKGDEKVNRIISSIDMSDLEDLITTDTYSEKSTVESNELTTDYRLTGVFGGKYLMYEKVFHAGSTFNYQQISIDITNGETDIVDVKTLNSWD